MKLGILGTGKVALLLSGAWRKAGHEITLGSRDPSSKNLDFEVTGLADCVSGADVVVNAILGSAALETVSAMDANFIRSVSMFLSPLAPYARMRSASRTRTSAITLPPALAAN